jgi:pyruvate formate lyase activating enzyme
MTHKGSVFNIERYAVSDGPGIRTLVFLKGCPLKCLWCANPEGEKYEKNLVYTAQDCIGCRECVTACPLNAIRFNEDVLKIDRRICDLCGNCVEQCYSNALQFDSMELTVDDVIASVCEDMPFYKKSGIGGITLSGGEPLFQLDFVSSILKACKEKDIHTAIETSGFCKWEHLSRIISRLDFILFDIKHMNPKVHRKLTGVDNKLILSNLSKIAGYSVPVVVRMPVVPRYNDAVVNVREMAVYLRGIKNVSRVELLPYHRLGISKYRKMEMHYPLPNVKPPTSRRLRLLKEVVESEGLECRIEGDGV